MSEKPILKAVNGGGEPKAIPPDAKDFDSLWIDQGLSDGIVNVSYHTVPVGKPKDFFRTHPDQDYRRRTEIYTHKPEGAIDEQHYIIAPAMRGRIDEAKLCTLIAVVYRDGSPRLWPIKFPKDGEKDNDAWVSARAAARVGITQWTKLVWVRRAYVTRNAQPGYAPDPDFSKLPSFDDLVNLAFGEHGIIRDTSHPVYRELFGAAPDSGDGDVSDI
jgi:hypothetical protein